MFTVSDIKYDVNIDNILEKGNIYGEILEARGWFAADPYGFKVKGLHMDLAMATRTIVWIRDRNAATPYVDEDENGQLWYHTPLLDEEEQRGKDGSRFILHPGCILAGLWVEGTMCQEAYEFLEASNNNDDVVDKAAFDKALLIRENLINGGVTAIKNILEKRLPGRIGHFGNDVLIDGKKVFGCSQMLNNHGNYNHTGINFRYDYKYFQKVLTEDEYHRATKMGITSIEQEIPGYTLEEVVAEYSAEVVRLANEVENLYGIY